jgi:hypothetical protein
MRLAFGGIFAPLSSIHQDGFASTAYHSWENTLAWDNYTGDYGPGFLGMILGSATYVWEDDSHGGLIAFGGQIVEAPHDKSYSIVPRDAVRRRIYLQSLSIFLEVDAGCIVNVEVNQKKITLQIAASPGLGVPSAKQTVLWVGRTSWAFLGNTDYVVDPPALQLQRGGWLIPLGRGSASITIEIR